ncbi:AlbA family DNA-binding domain-containing protein [Micromonospora sp. WMMC250]|uniref:AlbA family DNA-binding domain-containing protein n=1 Tax=Micromonospora sp. WMMC250 TaxID=3014781 RepID=UPI003FA5A34C
MLDRSRAATRRLVGISQRPYGTGRRVCLRCNAVRAGDAAVAAGVIEANDLDWKSELPPARGLPQTDFPKDVAAMANSGGVIVFGVREEQKAATARADVGGLDEAYERSLRSARRPALRGNAGLRPAGCRRQR